jgi:hypothetical protein
VSDEESALVAPDLTLLPEEVGQREHCLRGVINENPVAKALLVSM